MKPTSEILERIEKCSSEHKDGVFTRLYRYLLREDIYYAAYQKLYANKGATTQGIDDDTADGFSDFYIKELIQSLKDGTYKANPVRREYIPKKNGKLRPLGIPSFRDKLLQEVVRMILEARNSEVVCRFRYLQEWRQVTNKVENTVFLAAMYVPIVSAHGNTCPPL